MTSSTPNKPAAHVEVAQLLRLRHWAISVIGAGSESARDTRSVANIPASVWRLFFELERCASIVLHSLASSGAIAELDASAVETLRKTAATETQSALHARTEGRELAAIASRLDSPVVVLKGGVRAIEGDAPALPLVDIDILVRQGSVGDAIAELRAAGLGEPLRAMQRHQAISPAGDRLAVEVHWTTHYDGRALDPGLWERLVPLRGVPGLMRLGAQDSLLHLLHHATMIHRQRSVSLRDVYLIGLSAVECRGEDLDAVHHELVEDANGWEMAALLNFSNDVASGAPALRDPFLRTSATFYSGVALLSRPPWQFASKGALAFALEIELRRVSGWWALRNAARWRGTGIKSLTTVADRFPRVGAGVLGIARAGYYSAVAASMLPLIRATKEKALHAFVEPGVPR
ncbi:MAG: nucleotidyltransferase family protein [Gemmatimonadales bacterium]